MKGTASSCGSRGGARGTCPSLIFRSDRVPPYLKVWIGHWPGWGYIPGGIHSIDQFRYIEIHTWLRGLWNKTKEIILRLSNEKSRNSSNVHLSTTSIALQRPPFLANSPYTDSCLNLSTAINSLQRPLSSASKVAVLERIKCNTLLLLYFPKPRSQVFNTVFIRLSAQPRISTHLE